MTPNQKAIRVLTTGSEASSFAERALHFETDLLLIGSAPSWRSALERQAEQQPDVLLLEAGRDDNETVAAVEAFAERVPGVAVVVLDARISLASLRRGMLAGAAGYLALPPSAADLLVTLRRAGSAALGRHGSPEQRSTVTAVWSPKGGAGCSTLAVNLAIALGRSAATIVVDADPDGDVEVLLDLTAGPTLADLLIAEPDAAAINDASLPHAGGVRALLAPPGTLAGAAIDPQRLRRVIGALRGSFRHIVVDAGTALDDRVFALLDTADRIVVVITPEPAALRRLSSFTELAAALGMEHKLVLVLNRYLPEQAAYLAGAERTLGLALERRIGDATREMAAAAVEGVPLLLARPEHPVAREIAALAGLLG